MAKNLTIEKAKQIALDISLKVNPIDHREYFLLHSQKVGKVAKLIAKKLGIDTELLETAGRLHDIGYSKDFAKHAEFSFEILKELDYEIDEKLEDCILNHSHHKQPKTLEGKIFQIADKMSIFDFETIELMLKYGPFPFSDEDINLLKKMSENAIKFTEKFEI